METVRIQKYKFSKLIFIPLTIIMFLGIIYVGFSEGMIKLDGWHIQMFKTETIKCDQQIGFCEVILYNGSYERINKGETLTVNQFNMTKVNLLNYGTISLLLIGLLLNHYFFNKGYDFKKLRF